MTDESSIKIPVWFWIVAALALVWNLMGVMAYIGQVTMTPEALAELPEAERALYESTPAWVNGVFALSVFGGALGCIGLLLRKSWAKWLFIISLLSVLAQMYYAFFVSRSFEVFGPGAVIMPVMIIAVAVFLVWLSHMGKNKGWLH